MMTKKHEPKVEPAYPEKQLAAKNTFRILIIDTVENSDLLKSACKDVGHSVVSAQTIKDAFAFLNNENHADVIICAAYLENESMVEFLQELRKNPVHRHSMVMTLALAPGPIGHRLNTFTEKASQLFGADAFVSMPEFNAAQLISEISKLLPEMPMLEKDKKHKS
ncbi:response regulator [bacterium]|nr:response regulator [bacterium]QQR56815.1 MAG: response regulator [Candidatus Melainabacteria bacterium]